jgi:isoleucyl-tRNA synthetase
MALAMRTVSMGRALRNQHKLKVRQPLQAIHLVTSDEKERAVLARLGDILREELNVKKVIIDEREEDLVTLSAKANFKTLGARLGKDMKRAADLIAKLGAKELAEIRSLGPLGAGTYRLADGDFTAEIGAEDVLIHRSEKEGLVVMNEGTLTVALDSKLTEELMQEGLARDIVHQLQTMRKESGFAITDRIRVYYSGNAKVRAAFERFNEYISSEVLAIACAEHSAECGAALTACSFDGVEVHLAVEQVGQKG